MTRMNDAPAPRDDGRQPWEQDPDAWKHADRKPSAESLEAADRLLAELAGSDDPNEG